MDEGVPSHEDADMSIGRRLLLASAAAGCVMVAVLSLLLLYISPFAIAIGKDDAMHRLPFLAFAGLLGSAVALGLVVRGRSPSTLKASEAVPVAVAALVALASVGWAAFGIDSTRAVRDLPEAAIALPAARETHRRIEPATRGFGHHGATLTRTFDTPVTYREVLAFYVDELQSLGWTGDKSCVAGEPRDGSCTFYRDGFTFQVDLGTGNLAQSGSFTTRITGPP
jgi:hypothetical protein